MGTDDLTPTTYRVEWTTTVVEHHREYYHLSELPEAYAEAIRAGSVVSKADDDALLELLASDEDSNTLSSEHIEKRTIISIERSN